MTELMITCTICACDSTVIKASGANSPASLVNIGMKMAMLGQTIKMPISATMVISEPITKRSPPSHSRRVSARVMIAPRATNSTIVAKPKPRPSTVALMTIKAMHSSAQPASR
ncbi:hypothetical protein D3C85_1081470 [compost metagenome]